MSGPVVEPGEMVPVEPAELKKPRYKRVLVKLSGEALMGTNNFGIDSEVAQAISSQIIAVHRLGVEIAIVVGGGNIIRGVSALAVFLATPFGFSAGASDLAAAFSPWASAGLSSASSAFALASF